MSSEEIRQINEKLDRIENYMKNDLIKMIEYIVSNTIDKFVVEPDDFNVSIQNLQSSISGMSFTPVQSQPKKAKKSKKTSSSSSSDEEIRLEQIEGPAEKLEEINEEIENVIIQEQNIIYCDNEKLVNMTENKEISQISVKKVKDLNISENNEKILICGENKVITVENGIVNEEEGEFNSVCEFKNQVVGVGVNGLKHKHGGKDGYIKQFTQKIQLKNPVKVRSSKKRLFIKDDETNIMSILDDKFKIIKAINSAKIPDFCVVNDDRFVTISSKGLKIVNFDTSRLDVERYVKVEHNGVPVNLKKIECIHLKDQIFVFGVDGNNITYKIPIYKIIRD